MMRFEGLSLLTWESQEQFSFECRRCAVFYPGTPATMLVWLLPLSSAEAELARKVGRERFESILDKMAESIDLYDLHRHEVVSA